MTLFPSIVFSTKKRPKRRHSVFSHHAVDKCDVLSKPFLPLETRISSPTDLIDLVGHPRLTIELPPPLLATQQQDGLNNNSKNISGVASPITPLPSQPALDKTLVDISPSPPPPPPAVLPLPRPLFSTTRIHYSETLYNTEQKNVRHAPPPILQRRRSSPLPLGSRPQQQQPRPYGNDEYEEKDDELFTLSRQDEQDLIQLREQYDQEQATWRQRLHEYKVREEELMDLLESTRAKLDQLEANAAATSQSPSRRPRPTPSDKIQYHHHHHHHHYYYIRRGRPARSMSSLSSSSSSNNTHINHDKENAGHMKKHQVLTNSPPIPPPSGFWYSPYP